MKRSHSDMSVVPRPQRSSDRQFSSKDGSPAEHQPKISRKIRACRECQSRKIKCELGPGEKTCTRCQKLNLPCVVNKSLQMLLEDESEWKTSMEQKIQQLQAAVSEILHTANLPDLDAFMAGGKAIQIGSSPQEPVEPAVKIPMRSFTSPPTDNSSPMNRPGPRMAMTRENSQEPQAEDNPNEAIVAAPMASLFEVTKLRNLRSNLNGGLKSAARTAIEEDFISQGKVSEAEATHLFTVFSGSLNHYLWGGIALLHDSLTSVRRSSSVLLAAILSVTALHIPGNETTFDICYAEFLRLVSESMFDRYHSLDDVRGLCIGAFWLSDVSWKLSGHAVRIATELNLHQSFAKAMQGSTEHIERARLWYFLYVCDHHFSVSYGRPPVIHEDTSISCHEAFLQIPGITQADYRLHSQVGLFIILSRIYDAFGPDSGKVLSEEQLLSLRKYNFDIDEWRIKWEDRLAPNKYIASYPARGVILHYHYSKLQLNSLALRGFTQFDALNMSAERRDVANLAISSAISALTVVLDEPDIQKAVVGVPLYLHTTISLSTVFLLKVQLRWKTLGLSIDPVAVMNLLDRVILLLQAAKASERHLTNHIAKGLSHMLEKFKARESLEREQIASNGQVVANAAGFNGALPIDNMTSWPSMGGMPPVMYGDVMELYGLDEQYFPLGIFDALTAQMLG